MKTDRIHSCPGPRPTFAGNRILVSALLGTFLGAAAFPAAAGDGFRVRLGLVNGHLRECWFGCEKGATDKYDRNLDEMAPPPGIQTGYTAFISPDNKFWLYKDIRGFGDRIVWRFSAQVYGKKTIEITWEPKDLPDAYDFTLESGKKTLNMRETKTLSVPKTGVLIIRGVRRKPGAGPRDRKPAPRP
ncbi:MAG: hypothetical protein GXP31_05365 [Kiritimatiellaeota bacterium]|nr:hypothetical protein [Kiritimatiellota bacterium]